MSQYLSTLGYYISLVPVCSKEYKLQKFICKGFFLSLLLTIKSRVLIYFVKTKGEELFMYSRTCLKQAAKGQGKMLKTGACLI